MEIIQLSHVLKVNKCIEFEGQDLHASIETFSKNSYIVFYDETVCEAGLGG